MVASIGQQLKDMFETHSLADFILASREYYDSNNDLKSEILTGNDYKTNPAIQNFVASGSNITLTFNTDGIQTFKSSPKSLWPIMCSINELAFPYVENFLLLNTLWYCQKKPGSDAFLKPFVDEINKLYEEGVE